MKRIKNIITSLTAAALLTGLALNFNACTEESPFAPAENDADASITTLAKKGNKDKNQDQDDNKDEKNDENQSDGYAFSGSTTLKFENGVYEGGKIKLGHGSKLTIAQNSLTPPPGTPAGADVTITMDAELVNDELIFTFGPHGSQFDLPAQLRIEYGYFGADLPLLYYIENGNYIEQTPDHVDTLGKFMLLHFDHFSRYAVAWSNKKSKSKRK